MLVSGYLGYSRDEQPTSTNKQAWRCVCGFAKEECAKLTLLSCTQNHDHSHDLADCEAVIVIHQGSCSFDKNTESPHLHPDHWIFVPGYTTVSALCCCLQELCRIWSSSESSWVLTHEIDLTMDDCLSLAWQSMLQLDKEENEFRITVFGTADCIIYSHCRRGVKAGIATAPLTVVRNISSSWSRSMQSFLVRVRKTKITIGTWC